MACKTCTILAPAQLPAFISVIPVLAGIKAGNAIRVVICLLTDPQDTSRGRETSNKLISDCILELPEPKLTQALSIPPDSGLECTHEELFQTKGLCYLSLSVLPPGGTQPWSETPNQGCRSTWEITCGKGSSWQAQCCCLKGLIGFIWAFLGLFGFICFTDTFCVQAHLSHQKEAPRNTMGAAQTLLASSCLDLTEALLVCCFAEF